MILYVAMIISGLAMIVAGFWGTYNTKSPWNMIASIFLPIGLIIALIGVLLVCIPNFFQG